MFTGGKLVRDHGFALAAPTGLDRDEVWGQEPLHVLLPLGRCRAVADDTTHGGWMT